MRATQFSPHRGENCLTNNNALKPTCAKPLNVAMAAATIPTHLWATYGVTGNTDGNGSGSLNPLPQELGALPQEFSVLPQEL
jgi:hypothetical protein